MNGWVLGTSIAELNPDHLPPSPRLASAFGNAQFAPKLYVGLYWRMVERRERGGESVKLEGGEARGGVVLDVEAAAASQDRLA
jgi:hypothetical protein